MQNYRKFYIENEKGEIIDLQKDPYFASSPQGLGLSYTNSFLGDDTYFINYENKLDQNEITLETYIGVNSNTQYEDYKKLAKFLTTLKFKLHYRTDAGNYQRDVVFRSIDKTEVDVTTGCFISDIEFLSETPWRQNYITDSNTQLAHQTALNQYGMMFYNPQQVNTNQNLLNPSPFSVSSIRDFIVIGDPTPYSPITDYVDIELVGTDTRITNKYTKPIALSFKVGTFSSNLLNISMFYYNTTGKTHVIFPNSATTDSYARILSLNSANYIELANSETYHGYKGIFYELHRHVTGKYDYLTYILQEVGTSIQFEELYFVLEPGESYSSINIREAQLNSGVGQGPTLLKTQYPVFVSTGNPTVSSGGVLVVYNPDIKKVPCKITMYPQSDLIGQLEITSELGTIKYANLSVTQGKQIVLSSYFGDEQAYISDLNDLNKQSIYANCNSDSAPFIFLEPGYNSIDVTPNMPFIVTSLPEEVIV